MPSDIQELQRAFDMNVKAIDEAYDRTAKRCHLSPSSFDILYTLFAYGDGCTQKELYERCYDGKQTVNSAVHKMQRDGQEHARAPHRCRPRICRARNRARARSRARRARIV